MSIGRANNPTPPNKTTNIHPKKDMMAIIYTASEVSSVKVISTVTEAPGLLVSLIPKLIYLYGKSTYLKNAQLINSIITETAIAPPK